MSAVFYKKLIGKKNKSETFIQSQKKFSLKISDQPRLKKANFERFL